MTSEQLARQSYRAFEHFAALVYLAPEVIAAYKAIGINRRQGYFCGRAAPMGAVPGQVVAATFYNFNPTLVTSATDSGWKIAAPDAILAAKMAGLEEALQARLRSQGDEPDLLTLVERGLELVQTATADLSLIGRPLFAAYQSQAWPDKPLMALWHGTNLLREYRGDGHIAALLIEEISPVESLLMQSAYAPLMPVETLIQTRAWDAAAIATGQESLIQRDLLRDGVLTDKGHAVRERIEQHTDRLDRAPFDSLGETDSQELINIVGQFSERIQKRGII